MAARRAHNPEVGGPSPTPAIVVSGLSSEQKPPADVVSRPEKNDAIRSVGAMAPGWVALFLAFFVLSKAF